MKAQKNAAFPPSSPDPEEAMYELDEQVPSLRSR